MSGNKIKYLCKMKAKLLIIIGLICHLMAFGVVKHTVQVVSTDSVSGRRDTLWIKANVIYVNDTILTMSNVSYPDSALYADTAGYAEQPCYLDVNISKSTNINAV